MSIKISHSAMTVYTECAQKWKYRYRDKIVSKEKGSALFFGSAMDEALNYMLLNKDDKSKDLVAEAVKVFNVFWEQQKDNEGKIMDLPMNPDIKYSKYDFDIDFLEKSDWAELYRLSENPINDRNDIADKLKNTDWQDLEEKEKMLYNFSSWLTLKRKAVYMIKAYYEQILPEIAEVIKVQQPLELNDGTGNIIIGFIDLIAKLHSGAVAVLDNKTTSVEYAEDSVRTSPQLALYQKVMQIEKENERFAYDITAAGYLVISKKLTKVVTKKCKSCGYETDSGHKTCNNMIDGKRCNGAWDKTLDVKVGTQIIVDKIPDFVQDMILENVDSVIHSITAEAFPRNFGACQGKFGQCEYYNLCYKRDMTGLIKKENTNG